MARLDPEHTLGLLKKEIPAGLRPHVVIVGSLAAAYHYRGALERRGIATKDADLLVHPMGAKDVSRKLSRVLLTAGWKRSTIPGKECFPKPRRTPPSECRAMRLLPPQGAAFYLEMVGLPSREQRENLVWKALDLEDGRYALPCFRFMGLAVEEALPTPEGFRRAAPAMMALANLLHHPTLGAQRVTDESGGEGMLRSSKDLGRVLALWNLAGEAERGAWAAQWDRGLRRRFPRSRAALARDAGRGLRALIASPLALNEAYEANRIGLLRGRNVDPQGLQSTAIELLEGPLSKLRAR